MKATISEDAEVLGGGDGDAVLVEGTELDGVTVERSFEKGHGRLVLAPAKQWGFGYVRIEGLKVEGTRRRFINPS